MTREERLYWLKQIESDIYVCSLDSTFEDDAKSCAIHSVIKELEQEPRGEYIDRTKIGLTDFEIVICDGDKGEALKMLIEKIKDAPCLYYLPHRKGRKNETVL